MRHLHIYRILLPLLGCAVIFLLAACGSGNPPATGSTPTASGSHTPGITPTLSGGNPPIGGTVPMPPTQTSCPLPLGTGRAAVTAHLQLGSHQNVIYVYNVGNSSSSASFLKRHDLTTGADIVIANLPGITISNAQVSADGQWILFVAVTGGMGQSGQGKLQMIRMDGQGQQTLYCPSSEGTNIASTLGNVQWTTNSRLVVFDYFTSSSPNHNQVYLLNMINGSVQLELSTGTFYAPITWLDTTRVYLSRQLTDSPPDGLFLLDTSRGANQPERNLASVFRANNSNNQACWSADSSYDSAMAFISQCTRLNSTTRPGAAAQKGPGAILIQPASGGTAHILYSNTTEAITVVRSISRTTLLFTVDNESYDPGISVDRSHNGLWKINTDGSGATLLTTTTGNLNEDSQFPWSNVSRDGSMYSFQITSTNMQALQFGPVKGGAATTFATTTPGSTAGLSIVGWTKL